MQIFYDKVEKRDLLNVSRESQSKICSENNFLLCIVLADHYSAYSTIINKEKFDSNILAIVYLKKILEGKPIPNRNIETNVEITENSSRHILRIEIQLFYQDSVLLPVEGEYFAFELLPHKDEMYLEYTKCRIREHYTKKTFQKFLHMIRQSNEKIVDNQEYQELYSVFQSFRQLFKPKFHFKISHMILNELYIMKLSIDKNNKGFVRFVRNHSRFQEFASLFNENLEYETGIFIPLSDFDNHNWYISSILQSNILRHQDGLDSYNILDPDDLSVFMHNQSIIPLYNSTKILYTFLVITLYDLNLEYEFSDKLIIPITNGSRDVHVIPNYGLGHKMVFHNLKQAFACKYSRLSCPKKNIFYHQSFGYYSFKNCS